MELASKILSDITIFSKYARYRSDLNRRETWEELVSRNETMHLKKFPQLEKEIKEAYKFVYDKKVLPSMRSLQFSGKPIDINPSRMYNCAFLPINDKRAFSEIMFLLLGGTGVGYSVQVHHVEQLPQIRKPRGKAKRYLIGDSIEGWADAIKILMSSYFDGKSSIIFDFSDIRKKGTKLITAGGRAPGPDPLKVCLLKIESILSNKNDGEQLSTLEAHDIVCFVADAVLSGGIRRAALLSLFSADDEKMLSCKSGKWYELNPQRARANNSASLLRYKVKKSFFVSLWERIKESKCGEPGIYFTNDNEWGCNPCQPAYATLLTPDGIETFKDVSIGDVIWSGKQWTRITNKVMTGIKPVYKYTTTTGEFIGTKEHRVISNGERIEVQNAETIDISLNNPVKKQKLDIQDVMDGIVLGDGTVHKASNNLVLLCIGNDDGDYFDSEITPLIKKHRSGINEKEYEIQTTISHLELPKTYDREVPNRFFFGDDKKKMGFLRGLFTANGSIAGNRVSLKQTSKKLIKQVQIMLSSLGIHSYITTNKEKNIKFSNGTYKCKKSYDINITNGRTTFRECIGFIQKYKQEKIIDGSSLRHTTSSIKEIEFLEETEVFDITVDAEEHTYWTGGCLVSNCCEIGLRPFQFCNLVEINASTIQNQKDFNERAKVCSFIATLQAGYTDFHYLRPIWQRTTEKDALIGIGITGIASNKLKEIDLTEGTSFVINENKRVSKLIGINEATRLTCIKPSGTSTLVLGCNGSGIHGVHDFFYIRRMRIGKNEALYTYLLINHPELLEDDYFSPNDTAIISVPQKAPKSSILRNESPIELLERVKLFSEKWIKPGHLSGNNSHNVSATISIKDDEWDKVGEWMWENREYYNGLSVLPFDGGTYKQAPFESCTEEEYNRLMKTLTTIDLTKVVEMDDNTTQREEVSCGGGQCEIV